MSSQVNIISSDQNYNQIEQQISSECESNSSVNHHRYTYNRDFQLSLKDSQLSIIKPNNLPLLPNVILESEKCRELQSALDSPDSPNLNLNLSKQPINLT